MYFGKEREARNAAPGEQIAGCYEQNFQPTGRILCGDFNFGIDSPSYQYQVDNHWVDAWKNCNGATAHDPTCGIFDSDQWPEGPHCRDFFWLSQELKEIDSKVVVDTDCSLSDHQPVLLGTGPISRNRAQTSTGKKVYGIKLLRISIYQ